MLLLLMLVYVAKYKLKLNLIPDISKEKLMHNLKKYMRFSLNLALPMFVCGFGFESNSLLVGSLKIDD